MSVIKPVPGAKPGVETPKADRYDPPNMLDPNDKRELLVTGIVLLAVPFVVSAYASLWMFAWRLL